MVESHLTSHKGFGRPVRLSLRCREVVHVAKLIILVYTASRIIEAAGSHWLWRSLLAACLVLGARVLADGVDVRRRAPFDRCVGGRRSSEDAGADDAAAAAGGRRSAAPGALALAHAGQPAAAHPTSPRSSRPGFALPPGRGGATEANAAAGPAPDPAAWRAAVGNAAVTDAWDRFSGAIVQEFVYDAWLSYLSPDTAAPAEVRRLLNTAFGEAARRARAPGIDWGAVLISDVCKAACDVIGQYRRAVARAGGRDALRGLGHAERDAALRAAMAREGCLHPAFGRPDGHYRVLRRLSDATVALLLPADELRCGLVQALVRELFACCALRSCMMYFTPQAVNKLIVQSCPDPDAAPAGKPASGTGAARGQGDTASTHEGAAALAAAVAAAAAGRAAFEARVRRTALAETAQAAGPLASGAARHSLHSAADCGGAGHHPRSAHPTSSHAAPAHESPGFGAAAKRGGSSPKQTASAAAPGAQAGSGRRPQPVGWEDPCACRAGASPEPSAAGNRPADAVHSQSTQQGEGGRQAVRSAAAAAAAAAADVAARAAGPRGAKGPGHRRSESDSPVICSARRGAVAAESPLARAAARAKVCGHAGIASGAGGGAAPHEPFEAGPALGRGGKWGAAAGCSGCGGCDGDCQDSQGWGSDSSGGGGGGGSASDGLIPAAWPQGRAGGAEACGSGASSPAGPPWAASPVPSDYGGGGADSRRSPNPRAPSPLGTRGGGGAAAPRPPAAGAPGGGGSGAPGGGGSGASGCPWARVVGAEVVVAEGREAVLYLVEAGDEAGEWIVRRRLGHFELLHSRLKASCPRYRSLSLGAALPRRRRVAAGAAGAALAARRRGALDAYVCALACEGDAALGSELFEFLSPRSQIYTGSGREIGGSTAGSAAACRAAAAGASGSSDGGSGASGRGAAAGGSVKGLLSAKGGGSWPSLVTLGRAAASGSGGGGGSDAAQAAFSGDRGAVGRPLKSAHGAASSEGSVGGSSSNSSSGGSSGGSGGADGSPCRGGTSRAAAARGLGAAGWGPSCEAGATPAAARGSFPGAGLVAWPSANLAGAAGGLAPQPLLRAASSPFACPPAAAGAAPARRRGGPGPGAAGLLAQSVAGQLAPAGSGPLPRPASPESWEVGLGGQRQTSAAAAGWRAEGAASSRAAADASNGGSQQGGGRGAPGTPEHRRPREEPVQQQQPQGRAGAQHGPCGPDPATRLHTPGGAAAPVTQQPRRQQQPDGGAQRGAAAARHASAAASAGPRMRGHDDSSEGSGGARAAPPAEPEGGGPSAPPAAEPCSYAPPESEGGGLSAPLYELVDFVLQLRGRGWVRRQVVAIARQALSLVAGGAVEAVLARAAAAALSPRSVAGVLDALRGALWPGGVFYSYTPAGQAAAAARRAAQEAAAAAAAGAASSRAGISGTAPPGPPAAPGGRVLPPGLSAERYLEPAPLLPEEAAHAEAARRRVLSLPVPGPLLALLGRGAWFRALHELYDLAQCPTALLQLGHAVLAALLVALFPELRATARQLRAGPPEAL